MTLSRRPRAVSTIFPAVLPSRSITTTIAWRASMPLVLRRAFLVPALLFFSSTLSAQHATRAGAEETVASVPALERFHEVIFTLWHTAWRSRDVALVRSLLPDVERGADSVTQAPLPGILRDKRRAWESGVRALAAAVSAYRQAAAGTDSTALLDAVEMLHMRYEGLVRVIRPVLKEIDDFHATLYLLYHYHAPAMALDSIASSTVQLIARMEALNRATLPPRRASKQQAFDAARASLETAVRSLSTAVKTGKSEVVQKAVERVHEEYQTLERVFE